MKSRLKALMVISAVALSFFLLFVFFGYEQTWRFWNIPVLSPGFADLRVITHGADSVARGLDPLVNNPGDPWGRPLNYPRIWQSLYLLGINKSHTIGLGMGIIVSFFIGVIMVLPNANNRTVYLVVAALASPAVLLGIERSNIDLFIFFLVASSIIIANRFPTIADAAIIFATALKLFPFFGLPLLLRLGKRLFVQHALSVFTVLFLYLIANWSELKLISQATPRATDLSYGMNVAWMHINTIYPSLGLLPHLICLLFVIIAACLLFIACTHSYDVEATNEEFFRLDSFRVGSSIYIGTFLIGNNWDYRLVFLILTIPQLSSWAVSSSRKLRWCSVAALCAMFVSMWYLVILKLWENLAARLIYLGIPWILDEISNWSLFLLLAYLFSLALPQWAKDSLLYPLRLAKRSAAPDRYSATLPSGR